MKKLPIDSKTMKVRVRIVFEVEYPLCMDFYKTTDEDILLRREQEYVSQDPELIMELFSKRGTFETSVKRVK